jgi:hypothetical protein
MLNNSISQCTEAAEHEAVEQDADSVHSAVYVLQFDASTGTLQQPQGMPALFRKHNCTGFIATVVAAYKDVRLYCSCNYS